LVRLVDSIVDETQRDLKQIESTGTLENQKTLAELKKRTLIDKQYDSQTIHQNFAFLYLTDTEFLIL
jgi:hypothetical protein